MGYLKLAIRVSLLKGSGGRLGVEPNTRSPEFDRFAHPLNLVKALGSICFPGKAATFKALGQISATLRAGRRYAIWSGNR